MVCPALFIPAAIAIIIGAVMMAFNTAITNIVGTTMIVIGVIIGALALVCTRKEMYDPYRTYPKDY